MPLIDCDVHPLLPTGFSDLLPYVSKDWQRRLSIYSGWGTGRRPSPIAGTGNVGANYANDANPPSGLRPGADAEFLAEHLLDGHGVTQCLLNPVEGLYAGRLANIADMIQITRATNDYFVDKWLPVDDRFNLSITVQTHDPQEGAAEVRRLTGIPRVAAVQMTYIDRAMGHRHYYPVYEAAAEAGLPIVIHPGSGDGEFQGCATYAVAPPSNYTLTQATLPVIGIAQVNSLVFEGVFQTFPQLKVVLVEYGSTWVAPIMWRMDDKWRALRVEVPWLEEPPSHIVRRHIRFTSQPLEDQEKPEYRPLILEMMHADETLLFSTDYPHWDNEFPEYTLNGISKELKDRICFENALETFPAMRAPASVPV